MRLCTLTRLDSLEDMNRGILVCHLRISLTIPRTTTTKMLIIMPEYNYWFVPQLLVYYV